MIGLSRKFKIMDDSGDGELQFVEFKKAMNEMDFSLNDKDLHRIFDHFDADASRTISYEEFIQGVRDPLTPNRLDLINMAFKVIDKDGSGVIEAAEVASCYDASKHPEVMSGRKTEQAVLSDFLSTFDVGGVVDGCVTLQEFTNYYHNISASIFNEEYFELMIRNAWHISGGKGAAANSANKRVLVTDSQGKQSVVEIKNDLGVNADDKDEMIKRLRAQGVDVAGIDIKGGAGDEDDDNTNALNPDYRADSPASVIGVNYGKGQGASVLKTQSQITFAGGTPEDDVDYRKKMGLSKRSNNSEVGLRDARNSNLGADFVEKAQEAPVRYEPSGAAGAGARGGGGGGNLGVLCNKGNIDDILAKLKVELVNRGARGMSGIARKFRIIDDDNSKSIDSDEFAKAMKECNLTLTNGELLQLFKYFDQDGNGSIGYEEFLEGVRGEPNERRVDLIMLAFGVLDKDGSGIIEPSDLVGVYDPSKHPDVLTGKKTPDEVLAEFLDTFDVGGEKDGLVTKKEFVNYYKNVSASIDMDDYFELMIRNAWHIPGGNGWCENSANTRVSVTMKDGSTTIVEIENDLGLRAGDKKEAMLRLRKQGLNPQSVAFFDGVEDVEPVKALNMTWVSTFTLG